MYTKLISTAIIVLAFAVFTNALSPEGSQKQEEKLPALMDLAQLKLRVTNTEVVDEIRDQSFPPKVMKATEGYNICVVTLEGTASAACQVSIATYEFTAMWKKHTPSGAGPGFAPSRATSLMNLVDVWLLPSKEGGTALWTSYIRKPGPVMLKVAFSLPEDVTSFFIGYRTLAEGKAEVLAESGGNPWE